MGLDEWNGMERGGVNWDGYAGMGWNGVDTIVMVVVVVVGVR